MKTHNSRNQNWFDQSGSKFDFLGFFFFFGSLRPDLTCSLLSYSVHCAHPRQSPINHACVQLNGQGDQIQTYMIGYVTQYLLYPISFSKLYCIRLGGGRWALPRQWLWRCWLLWRRRELQRRFYCLCLFLAGWLGRQHLLLRRQRWPCHRRPAGDVQIMRAWGEGDYFYFRKPQKALLYHYTVELS